MVQALLLTGGAILTMDAVGEIVGVAVKASATVRAHDFRGLVHMRESIGQRLLTGVLVYAGARTLPFGERLWALPFKALWTE
jgi:hypothetical protein